MKMFLYLNLQKAKLEHYFIPLKCIIPIYIGLKPPILQNNGLVKLILMWNSAEYPPSFQKFPPQYTKIYWLRVYRH